MTTSLTRYWNDRCQECSGQLPPRRSKFCSSYCAARRRNREQARQNSKTLRKRLESLPKAYDFPLEKIDDPRLRLIVDLRRQGLTIEEIGQKIGLTRARVSQLLLQADSKAGKRLVRWDIYEITRLRTMIRREKERLAILEYELGQAMKTPRK